MTALISTQVHDAANELIQLARTPGKRVAQALPATINRFLSWPFRADPGLATDLDGQRSEHFAAVVYTKTRDGDSAAPVQISADALAAVIDVSVCLDSEQLRRAYQKVAHAKSLRKSPAPQIKGVPHTTVTLGIILAVDTGLPIEALYEELDRLNQKTPSAHWPDMVVVLTKGTINYAVQFPGEGLTGDFLPPAEGFSSSFVPPMYIVPVMKPAGTYSLNKMFAFLFAHLVIFMPGAGLPNWVEVLDGTPRDSVTLGGYQYNLGGQLVPVAKHFYNDRYVPQRSIFLQDAQGNRLAALQFLPWQDGGVVLSTGKLPLEGLLIFLGKKALERGGTVKRGDRQLSYVLPITQADFWEMLNRIQRQSNITLRTDPTSFLIQKLADEGSSTPFVARLFMGIIHLRDAVFPNPSQRQDFDKAYEFVLTTIMNTRKTAQDIAKLFSEHAQKVLRGEVAQVQGSNIYVEESIDKELRKQTETLINGAVRALKQGMQEVTQTLQVNIGFLFKKSGTFSSGLEALQASDPKLAEYLRNTRQWSEQLVQMRNALEHTSSTLPRVRYSISGARVEAKEPQISGQRVSEFAIFIVDRLACFVEEVTAHCLQARLPEGVSVTEIPLAERDTEKPERFRLTLRDGGMPVWGLTYHQSTFDEN